MADLKHRLSDAYNKFVKRLSKGPKASSAIDAVSSNTKEGKAGTVFSSDKESSKLPMVLNSVDLWTSDPPIPERVMSPAQAVPSGGISCRNCFICNCNCTKSCNSCRSCHCNNYFSFIQKKRTL